MTVLVTGATGFLGGHLVPLLSEQGAVRALVRPQTSDLALRALGVEVVTGDIRDPATVRRAAEGCALVYHLAGVVAHEAGDAARLRSVNVEGTRTLVEAASQGTRIVHVSSVAAIGPAPDHDHPADERQAFPPWAERFPYAATKRAGEEIALAATRRGLDVVVANPGFLIGPSDPYRVSTWAIGQYLRGRLRFHAPGGLSYVDARDVAAGLVALAERGRTGERYILTNREGNLAHAELFERVGSVTGRRRLMIGFPPWLAVATASLLRWPVKPGEVRAAVHWWFYDPAKAETELGFSCCPIDETIAATAAQYIGT